MTKQTGYPNFFFMLKFGKKIRVLNSALSFLVFNSFSQLRILILIRSAYRFLGRLLYGSSSGEITRFRLDQMLKVSGTVVLRLAAMRALTHGSLLGLPRSPGAGEPRPLDGRIGPPPRIIIMGLPLPGPSKPICPPGPAMFGLKNGGIPPIGPPGPISGGNIPIGGAPSNYSISMQHASQCHRHQNPNYLGSS